MASGIKDKVAILGMGCSHFGERWDVGSEQLMVEAFNEALKDADIGRSEIGAAWLGSALDQANVGNSAIPLSTALRLQSIPVSRVENMCATGTEALRGAAYAVAAGACDIALALGVEKLKDTGYGGLPIRTKGLVNDLWMPYGSAPGTFAQLAEAYSAKHRVPMEDLKRGMAHVSWKSHENGARNPKAHIRKRVTMEDLFVSPEGGATRDVLDGFFDAEGGLPCQIDGGLKCFGHPIGASGLRMLYEMYLQFQGRAGARQLKDPRIGMTHNLGGAPRENVSSVAIVGRYG